MRFACSRCGKRYASTDEPVPGRIYAIGCKCGHTIVVKGPEVSGGVRNGPTAEVEEDPFAAFYGKYQLPAAQRARPAPASRGAAASSPRPAGAGALSAWPERALAPPPRAVEPAPLPFDPVAASHGLLLDVDHARALSGGSMATESLALPEAQEQDEVSITFSDRLTLPGRESPRPWLLVAATVLAVLVIAGGAFALLSRRAAPPPAAEPETPPARSAPPTAVAPSPTPPLPVAAAPERPPSAPPSSAPASASRPAAPVARPARTPRRAAAPPVVAEEAQARPPTAPGSAASSPALLDLLSRKEDAPAASSPAEPEARGASVPGVQEVQAVIQRNRSGFDACVEDAGPAPQLAGRKVMLSVTVNPSGIVTSPRLDDAQLDGSAAGVCLKSAARKLVLSPFTGDPVRLRVPLTLGP